MKIFASPSGNQATAKALQREFEVSLLVGRADSGQRVCEVVGWSLLPQVRRLWGMAPNCGPHSHGACMESHARPLRPSQVDANGDVTLHPAIVMELLPDSLGGLLASAHMHTWHTQAYLSSRMSEGVQLICLDPVAPAEAPPPATRGHPRDVDPRHWCGPCPRPRGAPRRPRPRPPVRTDTGI